MESREVVGIRVHGSDRVCILAGRGEIEGLNESEYMASDGLGIFGSMAGENGGKDGGVKGFRING